MKKYQKNMFFDGKSRTVLSNRGTPVSFWVVSKERFKDNLFLLFRGFSDILRQCTLGSRARSLAKKCRKNMVF